MSRALGFALLVLSCFAAAARAEDEVTVSLSLFGGLEVQKAFVKKDGTFKFSDVPAGTHKLEIHAAGYDFSYYRVDMSDKLGGRARVARMEAPTKPLGVPLIIAPAQQAQQFEKRPAFSVWSILGNPFYMMMFLMVIMIFVVPRTMEAMDPEERKAMQEQMANGGGGLLSSILSGSFDADEYKRKIEEERALTAAKAKGGGGGASGSGGGGGASGSGGKKAN